jgi:hypothetical protein
LQETPIAAVVLFAVETRMTRVGTGRKSQDWQNGCSIPFRNVVKMFQKINISVDQHARMASGRDIFSAAAIPVLPPKLRHEPLDRTRAPLFIFRSSNP